MSHRYKDFADRIDVDGYIDAVGILGEYDEGRNKAGQLEYIGQCPDPWGLHKHGDSTGKFALNVEKRVYNCFVCGGGNLLSLTMAVLDLDPDEATDWLRDLAEDEREISDERFMSEIEALLAQLDPQRHEETLPYYNAHVLDKWERYRDGLRWWNNGGADGKVKGIDWETLVAAGACYAPAAVKHAPRDRKTGTPIDDAYYGPCIIFPHYVGDRLVGWQHRWLDENRPKWCNKYTNTPDFPKRSTLYYPLPERARHTHLPVVVVESVPTALYVCGLGWPAVATFGATITPEQLKLLRRFQAGVIFAPDNDKPGFKSLFVMADYLDGFIPVSYIHPDGKEGDDLLDRGKTENVMDLILTAERIT